MSPHQTSRDVKRSASTWPSSRRALLGYGALFGFVILCQITALLVVLSRSKDHSLTESAEHVREVLTFSAASLDRIISQADALLLSLPELLEDQVAAESVTPLARRLLAAQSSHIRAVRSLAIVDASGEVLAAEPPASIAAFDRGQDAKSQGLQVGAPYRSPKTLEPSIQLWRRLEFSGGVSVYGVAKLSIPALATEISASTIRQGVALTISTDGRTIIRTPYDDAAIGSEATAPRQGGETIDAAVAALTARSELRIAPIALKAEMTLEAALAEWLRDTTWIVSLSLVTWLFEIAAVTAAAGYVASRARSRAKLEAAARELASSRLRAQSAADARGMFIANMNHELRTPLNAVIGFSEILSEELFGPIGNPRYREYAADIRASGEHLLSLIDDIIDFSTIDMGHRKLNIQTISLSDAIDDALRLTRPQAQARNLAVIVSGVAPDAQIEADGRAFRQVLLNLLSNAIKFSPRGGRILIGREPDCGPEWVELSIADSGPGVAAEDLDRLGEEFFRTRTATDGAIGGAGLGLSISFSLMRLMNGKLSVRSKLGEGATVVVKIPAGKIVKSIAGAVTGAIDAPADGVNAGARATAD